jgi:hypothetical protein
LLDAQLRALILTENRLLSARIRRLHRNALLEMAQLRFYTEQIFLPKLDGYLELRVRGESAAIDAALYHVRLQIEAEKPLERQLRLEGENVFVDAEVLNLAPAEANLPKFTLFNDLFDPAYAARLTFAQLIHVTNQLKALCVGGSSYSNGAPLAGLDVKASELYTLFLSQFYATHSNGSAAGDSGSSFYPIVGEKHLPLKWGPDGSAEAGDTKGALLTASAPAFFRELVGLFAGGAASAASQSQQQLVVSNGSAAPAFVHPYVDYRDFLISAALLDSVATPSLAQLLSMQSSWTSRDADQDGRVTWAEFEAAPLWIESGPTGEPLQQQRTRPSDSRTAEPVQRLKEFFFHLFAVEQEDDSSSSSAARVPGSQTFVLSALDLLLYLCFDDDSSSSSSPGTSGLEKAQLLVSNVPQAQWGPLTAAFVQRYLQPAGGRNKLSAAASTTAKDKFTRKDLTKAAQAGAASA